MGNEGSHRRILNNPRWSNLQFVLRHRNIIGGVEPIPLRERTALNVNGIGLRRLVDLVRSEKAVTCPTGVRGLVPSDFGRLAAIICQEKWPFSSYIAIPLTPGPHGSCFTPSSVWSYTDSNIQVPTISSLRVFCWPSASLGRRAIPRQRTAIVVIASVVCRFIVFIVLWFVLPPLECTLLCAVNAL
jgi:hypothetical protein